MRWLSLLLLVTGICLPEITALFMDGYSPVSDYISALGQSGYASQSIINYGAFLPTGLISLVLIYAARRIVPDERLLKLGLIACASVSLGYIIAALFPCLPGCPVPGTGRQAIHNLGGLLEYAGGVLGLGLVTLGLYRANAPRQARHALVALFLFAVGVALMSSIGLSAHKGLFQRIADYSFFLWLASLYWIPEPKQTSDNR